MANMTQTQTRHDARPTTPRPEPIAGTRPEPRQVPIAGTRPRQSASAGELVLAYLRIQAGVLSSLEPMVRADEPDAVHQMRVATRRLRAAFRSFGTVIPRSRSEKVAGELKWLGGLLGPVQPGEAHGLPVQPGQQPRPGRETLPPQRLLEADFAVQGGAECPGRVRQRREPYPPRCRPFLRLGPANLDVHAAHRAARAHPGATRIFPQRIFVSSSLPPGNCQREAVESN